MIVMLALALFLSLLLTILVRSESTQNTQLLTTNMEGRKKGIKRRKW